MLRRLILCLMVGTFMVAGRVAGAQDAGLEVGEDAPAFEAPSADGDTWKSSEVVGEKYLVVYFYPAAMSGGCTKQACAFRDDRTKLVEMGAEVVGVSGDDLEGLRIFQKSHNLNFPLLSDLDGAIATKFGVPIRGGGTSTREVDGEEVDWTRGVTASRWTFIIGLDGKIAYRDTEVDAAGDSQAVLAALKTLKG